MAIIINANREGYGTDQITNTMTVGELIDALSDFDEDTPVYIGNDRKSYGWYTYGGITQITMNNGKLTPLFPGNGFLLNGQAFVYEKYENENCVIRDTKKKSSIFVYGYEGLKRTVRQFGYELMKEEEQDA